MNLIDQYKSNLKMKEISLSDDEIKDIVKAQEIVARIIFDIWKKEKGEQTIDKITSS